MAKYEVKGNKGTYVINGNDSSSEIKRGGSTIGYIKKFVTNKYEVKDKSSQIGMLHIQGSKLSLQTSSNKELRKIDCKGDIYKDDILKEIMTTYFE